MQCLLGVRPNHRAQGFPIPPLSSDKFRPVEPMAVDAGSLEDYLAELRVSEGLTLFVNIAARFGPGLR